MHHNKHVNNKSLATIVAVLLILTPRVSFGAEGEDVVAQARAAMERNDFSKARELTTPLALKGLPSAQNVLGDLSIHAGEVQQAIEWYRKAAQKGDAKAQNNLGMAYIRGTGVMQDFKEAAMWLSKSAEQGNAKAQNNLSIMYLSGKGVATDLKLAASWCEKAAQQNDPAAQVNMGLKYRYGTGVEIDYAKAIKWLKLASEQRWPPAEYALGEMYEFGLGTPQNLTESKIFYERAASKGFSAAQSKLVVLLPPAERLKKGAFLLRPGDKFSILLDAKFANARVAEKPAVEGSIDFSLSLVKDSDMTMLSMKNNLGIDIIYDCSIRSAPQERFEITNVLPIKAGLAAFESWPGRADAILVSNIRSAKSDSVK